MQPKAIPGYFYDADRNRYFKIAHASLGNPSGPAASHGQPSGSAAHTLSNVKKSERQKRESRRLAAHEMQSSLRTQRPRPTRLTDVSFSYDSQRLTLGQAIGRQSALQLSGQDVWPRSFHKTSNHEISLTGSLSESPLRFCSVGSTDTSVFARRNLCFSVARNIRKTLHECEGTEFFTSVTASNINGFSWAATSCTHLNGGNRLYVGSLSRIANVCQDFDETSSVCAFSPNKGHLAFAGSALHLLQMADDKGIQMVSKFKSDVLDMKYLDSNVLVLGCRNGLIKLLDLRAEPYRATDRFKHAGGVCKLQILSNSHQILAAGLRDISLYDLRNATRPYIRFEGGEQLENPDDVHVAVLADDSRIMAAQKTKLKLWSINGKYLDTFDHREDIHGIETSARDPLSCMISSRTGLHRVSIDVESGHKR